MVTRRDNFQRVYDLADRVLARLDPPLDPSTETAAPASVRQRFIADAVRALGITTAAWIADYHRLKPAVSERELAPLLERGELLAQPVQGWKTPGYVHRDPADTLNKARQGRLRATHTALLSPFDPLVWDRARASAMFDFDYALECYTPAAKRRYGYYVLPILHRGQLIGRLDAKAHRTEGVFEIKSLFLQPGTVLAPRLIEALADTVRHTARWHGTPRVLLAYCEPAALASGLRARWHAD
jgi:uncharacterized protein YcaQ